MRKFDEFIEFLGTIAFVLVYTILSAYAFSGLYFIFRPNGTLDKAWDFGIKLMLIFSVIIPLTVILIVGFYGVDLVDFVIFYIPTFLICSLIGLIIRVSKNEEN